MQVVLHTQCVYVFVRVILLSYLHNNMEIANL